MKNQKDEIDHLLLESLEGFKSEFRLVVQRLTEIEEEVRLFKMNRQTPKPQNQNVKEPRQMSPTPKQIDDLIAQLKKMENSVERFSKHSA